MPAPLISVVIAARARETRLSFALDALAAQTLPAAGFEVIVVRPAGAGAGAEAPPGLDVTVLESPDDNVSAQRNLGAGEARAPLVAFLGDDCRPAPGWLEALLEHAGPGRVLYGRTEPDPDESHLLYGIARTTEVSGPEPWFRACNIAYPRELLDRLGGFDAALAHRREDTDLGLRALAAGAEAVFCDEAVVHHAVEVRSWRRALAEAVRPTGEPELIARHPELREELYLRAFVRPGHAKVLLLVAGVLLWRRSRLLAALAAWPYVRELIGKRMRNPNPISPLGAFRIGADVIVEGTLDSVEVAARAGASAARGELVL